LSFFPDDAADDLFVALQRKAKLEGYMQTLAALSQRDGKCVRAGGRLR
jgi:hypothetical protein